MRTFNLNPIGNQTLYPKRTEATGLPKEIISSVPISRHIAATRDGENPQSAVTSSLFPLWNPRLLAITHKVHTWKVLKIRLRFSKSISRVRALLWGKWVRASLKRLILSSATWWSQDQKWAPEEIKRVLLAWSVREQTRLNPKSQRISLKKACQRAFQTSTSHRFIAKSSLVSRRSLRLLVMVKRMYRRTTLRASHLVFGKILQKDRILLVISESSVPADNQNITKIAARAKFSSKPQSLTQESSSQTRIWFPKVPKMTGYH